jgi:hypothetical protein
MKFVNLPPTWLLRQKEIDNAYNLPTSLITVSSKQPMMHAETNNLKDSKCTHLSVHIDCHTRKHCTLFDHEYAYLVPSELNFRFQISSSSAAIAFSCSRDNVNLFLLKDLGFLT